GASCPGTGTVVVDSGANGIAETRAQGAELVLRLATPRPLTMPIRRHGTASRTVKLAVFNEEFAGPSSRAYTLSVTDGSCPDDAANPANNAASVEIDAVDLNDL